MMENLQPEVDKKILAIKTRIINKIFIITAPVLHLAYFFSISRYIITGWLDVYAVHTIVILLFDLAILFRNKLSSESKIHVLPILFLVVAIYATYSFGFTGGFFFGIISVAMIAMLSGRRMAIFYSVAYLINFVIFGYGYVFGGLQSQVDLNSYSHQLPIWIALIATIIAQLSILVWGFSTYLDELQLLLKKKIIISNEVIVANNELLKSREEKAMLFRELHHRIKNNLNTVSSLLYLKSNMSQNPELRVFIKDTIQRINATSDLHNQLLKLEELSQLYSKAYFHKLIRNVQMSFPEKLLIQVKANIEDHKLETDLMLDIGYILNEILSNAYKYAYHDETPGEIRVSFYLDDDFYVLQIQDFGQGFNPEETCDSLGLMVIDSLVEKCGGDLSLDLSGGVKYMIRIPQNSNACILNDNMDLMHH
ncbi:MAG: sensor histidine kinase [Bacteroidota bacterium]